VVALPSSPAGERAGDDDEVALRKAGVSVDDDSLLACLRLALEKYRQRYQDAKRMGIFKPEGMARTCAATVRKLS